MAAPGGLGTSNYTARSGLRSPPERLRGHNGGRSADASSGDGDDPAAGPVPVLDAGPAPAAADAAAAAPRLAAPPRLPFPRTAAVGSAGGARAWMRDRRPAPSGGLPLPAA